MDESIRIRIVTVVVVTALCCIGIGIRVVIRKISVAPDNIPMQPNDIRQTRTDHTFSVKRFLTILDFRSLTDSSRRTVSLILLIPVGILVTAIYRRLSGFRTIGTFSPTLLALSQTKSDWKAGLPVFFAIFAVGIFFRMIFTPLKLPAFSRRGAVAVFVVLFLSVAVSFCEVFDMGVDPRAVLLPVVVTTMMIERFFIILGKDGNKAASYALLNSLIVAVCCFGLFAPILPSVWRSWIILN
jgi:hypothetical protein